MVYPTEVKTEQLSLPRLDDNRINVSHMEALIRKAGHRLSALIKAVANQSSSDAIDWQFIKPLESIESAVAEAWGIIDHLQSVAQQEDQKRNYQAVLEQVTQWNTALAQNEALYHWIIRIANHRDFSALEATQQKLVNNLLLHFRLAGVGLSTEHKQRYQTLQMQLAKDSATFENNLVDSSREQALLITKEAMLKGLPERVIKAAAEAAKEQSGSGWLLKMDGPTSQVVMANAADESLRRDFYTAWVTRASEVTHFDNSQLMYNILRQRDELSRLTQFNNYAERSLAADKVAETPQAVIDFLNQLIKEAMPQARHELKELQAFAEKQGKNELCEWDLSFFSEKLRQAKFGLQQQKLRTYFPLPHVLKELFKVLQEQFELSIEQMPLENTWDPQVKCLAIKNKEQALLGHLYLDLYARSSKRAGAWVYPYKQRRLDEANHLHLPIVFLTCNFAAPVAEEPALLTHEDVVTLFHEMGHALHHLLTQIDYASLSGMAGVAWDVVEFPSQLLEQFPWTPMMLKRLSRHYQTGERLSDETINALHQSRCFQAGLQLARQLEFSLFDFELHLHFDPNKGMEQIQAMLDKVRKHTRLLPVPSFNRFQHSFAHIFSGGYGAGYYSYLWAEVWAADAFERFVEEGLGQGVLNPMTGRDFAESVLALGGAVDMLTLFKKFRGRAPDPTIFLVQRGLLSPKVCDASTIG